MSLRLIGHYKYFLGFAELSKPLCQCKSFVVNPFRSSQYGPHFIEPIYRREDLAALRETGEAAKLAHIPIKAAKCEQTCSEFYDSTIEKFINYVMRDGEKELARNLVTKTLEAVKRRQVERYNKENDPEKKAKIELNAIKVFHDAVDNCKPLLQLLPVRRGGQTYQVPVPISARRAQFMAMNWLIDQAKADSKKTRFYDNLSQELIHASHSQGRVVKRKQDLHKQCEANRAYAHYRWG